MIQIQSCYIRRKGQSWVRSQTHHERALYAYQAFLAQGVDNVTISVPHEDGGVFVAQFIQANDPCYVFQDGEDTVEVMMERPERVAFINRITDC